jgi:hypothetical protein
MQQMIRLRARWILEESRGFGLATDDFECSEAHWSMQQMTKPRS